MDPAVRPVSRPFAVASGLLVAGLLAGCGGSSVPPSVSSDAPVESGPGLVLSSAIEPPMRARYERAVADLPFDVVTADAVVAGQGAIAVGAPVPGADAVVMMDLETAGRMLGRQLARCLESVGVVRGPIVVDAALPSAGPVLDERGYTPVVSDAPFASIYAERNGDVVGVVTGTAAAAQEAIGVLDANAQGVKVPVVAGGIDEQTGRHLDDGALCAAVRPSARDEVHVAGTLLEAIEAGDGVAAIAVDTVTVDGKPMPAVLVRPTLVDAGDVGE